MKMPADPKFFPAAALGRILSGLPANEPFEVTALLLLARRHGLVHCLAQGLASSSPIVNQEIQAARRAVFVRNFQHRRNGAAALAALAKAGIEAMPLKGWALLAAGYYENDEQRLCADFDLLVRPADLAEAHRALLGAAFTPAKRRATINGWVRRQLGQWTYLGENGQPLDLHWFAVGRAGRLKGEQLWAKARPARWEGQPLFLPHPADLASHLVFHAADQHSAHPLLQWRTALDLERILAAHPGTAFFEEWQSRFSALLTPAVLQAYLHFAAQILPAENLRRLAATLPPADTAIFCESFTPSLRAEFTLPPEEPSLALEEGLRRGSPWRLLRILCPSPGQLSYLHDLPLASPRLWLKYFSRPYYLWEKSRRQPLYQALRTAAYKRGWSKTR